MLCSGRFKLLSIDTCYLSADSRKDLIKCKDADGGSQITHYRAITSIPHIRSFHCRHVKSLSFVPRLVMMSPFSSVAVSLFNCPQCLVKINHHFHSRFLIALPRGWAYLKLDVQILKYLSLAGFFFVRKRKITQCRAAKEVKDVC